MGWFHSALDRVTGKPEPVPEPLTPTPPPPTSAQILQAARDVETQVAGKVPAAVAARVHKVVTVIAEMVPRLDRLGGASQQEHTVVATATSYLPEAVDGYMRLPRDFADRRVVHDGKTSLLIVCDQLDLLAVTLAKISDAVSRQDANALVAHGQFLADKFASSSLSLDGNGPPGSPTWSPTRTGATRTPPVTREPGRLEAP